MQKLLYITDQMEYAENSFIKSLFRVHLNKYFDVNTIFFSKFKQGIEKRENGQILVAEKLKENLFAELSRHGIDMSSYDFIIIRNSIDLLKQTIKLKSKYSFKVGFRLSFPKRMATYRMEEAKNKNSLLSFFNHKIISYNETNIINKCDIFLPTSTRMKQDYFKDVKIDTFELPSAIDPKNLQEKPVSKDDIVRFFYIGTFDRLRDFRVVLRAFDSIKNENFVLMLATKEEEYMVNLLEMFPELKNKIEICHVKSNDDYYDLVLKSDVGISLLPDLKLFNSSMPIKIIDFYTWGTPCIMSENSVNLSVFDANVSGWLSEFDEKSIAKKLKFIISLSKKDINRVGKKGQEKLFTKKLYTPRLQKKLTRMWTNFKAGH